LAATEYMFMYVLLLLLVVVVQDDDDADTENDAATLGSSHQHPPFSPAKNQSVTFVSSCQEGIL